MPLRSTPPSWNAHSPPPEADRPIRSRMIGLSGKVRAARSQLQGLSCRAKLGGGIAEHRIARHRIADQVAAHQGNDAIEVFD